MKLNLKTRFVWFRLCFLLYCVLQWSFWNFMAMVYLWSRWNLMSCKELRDWKGQTDVSFSTPPDTLTPPEWQLCGDDSLPPRTLFSSFFHLLLFILVCFQRKVTPRPTNTSLSASCRYTHTRVKEIITSLSLYFLYTHSTLVIQLKRERERVDKDTECNIVSVAGCELRHCGCCLEVTFTCSFWKKTRERFQQNPQPGAADTLGMD